MKKIFIAVIIFLSTLLFGCSTAEQYDIYVTTDPLQFLVEEIGKGVVSVGLIDGATAHNSTVEWTGKKLINLLNGDLLFYNGAGLDVYIDNEIKTNKNKKIELYKMEDYIEFISSCFHHVHDDEPHTVSNEACNESYKDPHFFLDPVLIKQASRVIYDVMFAKYIDYRNQISENYYNLNTQLDELISAYDDALKNPQKPILTTANLYGYYHARYNIDSISISNNDHSQNEIIKDYMLFVHEAKKHNIKYLIYEFNATSPYGDSIVNELNKTPGYNCEKLYFHTLEKLSKEDKLNNRNYITIMYENLEVLKKALE